MHADDFPEAGFPFVKCTYGDVYCLFRSTSFLAIGLQEHHLEFQLRSLLELGVDC